MSSRRAPRVPPAVMRFGVRQLGRRCLDPALPWPVQRKRLEQLTGTALLPRGTTVTRESFAGVPSDVVAAGPAGPASVASAASVPMAPSVPPEGADGAIGTGAARTVIHFHGGGYCVGSARIARSWAAHLSAAAGCRVILPEYRLAPEHPFPAALEDASAVVAEVLGTTGPGSVLLSGDSAGAGLALAATMARRDRDQPLPGGCILLSPWLDLSRDRRAIPELVRKDVLLTPGWLEACASAYAGAAALAEERMSPLRAPLSGLPPLLIQAGTDDLLAPDAAGLATAAAAAGVDVTYTRWPHMWHNFALQPGLLAAADSALAQAAWFVTRIHDV